jgi:transposase
MSTSVVPTIVPSAAAPAPSSIYLGLDVHKESIAISVLPAGASAPTERDRLPHDLRKLKRYCERLMRDGAQVYACYEASGAGYVLQRAMEAWGVHCALIAPSLVPKQPGRKRRNDRYDADQLARLYRSGALTVIRVPSAAEERVRDLVRCRTTLQRQLQRARQFVLKFCTRRGLRYAGGTVHWTQTHRRWLGTIVRSAALAVEDQLVLQEYLALVAYAEQRRDALDQQIERYALKPAYQRLVARLGCYRGFDTQASMVLATEIGDWQRFGRATELMAYVGLVPREDSSAGRERRGPITKAGNSHCRHVLVQAAWSYTRRARLPGQRLAARRAGQPALAVAHAIKAEQRLYALYKRLAERKGKPIAVVAVARELVGFLWAGMQDLQDIAPGRRPARDAVTL